MKFMLCIITLTSAFFMSSCVNEDLPADVATETGPDYNFDGIPDESWEEGEFSYFLFVDKNFDQMPDERHEYDSATNFLLSSKFDDDFNGYFETQVVIEQGVPIRDLVDTDSDGKVNLYRDYKNGIFSTTTIFKSGTPSTITKYDFKFGEPGEIVETNTAMTNDDFHKDAISIISAQIMSGMATETSERDSEHAIALDNFSANTLNVTIRALAFLFDAGVDHFHLKDTFVEDGTLPYLSELENAGYVTTRTISATEGEFIQILLTPRGERIRQALQD